MQVERKRGDKRGCVPLERVVVEKEGSVSFENQKESRGFLVGRGEGNLGYFLECTGEENLLLVKLKPALYWKAETFLMSNLKRGTLLGVDLLETECGHNLFLGGKHVK